MTPFRIVSLLGLLTIGGLGIYWMPASSAIAQETQKEVWTCPMHPQIIRDKPGNCPICGMQLVKRENEKPKREATLMTPDEAGSTIPKGHVKFRLSRERQQMIGVKTGIVEKSLLYKTIRASGRLAFDPDLYTAQNEYIEALRQLHRIKNSPLPEALRSAQRMVESSSFRLKVLGLSDEQIAKVGQAGKSDSSLLIGKDGADAWIYADVYETDLPDIRAGLSVEISSAFLQGQILKGKVVSIDRVIDQTTRTVKVRILVSKSPSNLRPQSYVDVKILSPLGEQVSVPLDAVFDVGAQAWVFLYDEDGHFEPRLITVRAYAGDRVVIASGLKGGERIVTSANFLIDSESRLRASFEDARGQESERKLPTCPENQYWDTGMSMCMPKVGK